MVPEFLWTFAVQELLKKVIKLAAGELRLIWGFNKELSEMTQMLRKNEIFLCDINTRKSHSMAVREWVQKLQHLIHDVDDLLDELVYEDLRRKNEIGKRKWVRNLVSFSNNYIVFRLNMVRKMKTLTHSLYQHGCEASPLGLVVGVESSQIEMNLNQLRETISKLDDIEILAVGRDDEVSSIVKKVIDASYPQVMSILPIVGMGGSGKTTLAKLVINHETIKEHFDKTVWVCVSEPFLINKILGAILEALNHTFGGSDNRETLLHKLQKEMHGKKYFLVLDDVWNENSLLWDELKSCLMGINAESSIVVTTRSVKVAETMETISRHHLSKLSNDQCWSLFTISANAKEIAMNPELKVVREELIKKIGGLPLVARVLGRTVKFQGDYERWLTSLKNVATTPLEEENVATTPLAEENHVLSILKLSVDRLPSSSLKQCFAYCSNFPKDFEFKKEQLIQMWMAQGFIQPEDGRSNITMEDIGDVYFNVLLSHCLFQDVIKDGLGRIARCKMHDLIHDIACDVSSNDHKFQIARKLRMLSYHDTSTNDEMKEVIHDKNVNFGCLRKNVKFDCLRVLILNSRMIVKYLLDSNSKLKHLRYLDFSCCSIKKLPKSIVSLYNLQTLRINLDIECLPKNLRQLVNLRHLEFSDNLLPLESSKNFKDLRLIQNLPHKFPHLSQLIHLQTLSYLKVGMEEGCTIRELGPLKNLKGRLGLFELNKVKSKEEAKDAKLVEKENLRELFFFWIRPEESGEGVDNIDLEVLEGLQPHKNLQSLNILGFQGNPLPNNIFVENLITIRLHDCKNCEMFPMLGQLVHLENLEIISLDGVKRIGNELYGNDSNQRTFFPKLKKFELTRMKNLEQWDAPNVTIFPLLRSFSIWHCPKLLNISTVFGCSVEDSVKHLTYFRIVECFKLTKLPNALQFCDSMEELRIMKCSNLNLHLELAHFTNLKKLEIGGRMEDFDFSFHEHLPSLVKLRLFDEGKIATSLPRQLEHLIALQKLEIGTFEGIEVLPEWLGNLTSLQSLHLLFCKNLKQLPSKETMLRLTRLRYLSVFECPQLLLGEGDPERAKVSHVPTIDHSNWAQEAR